MGYACSSLHCINDGVPLVEIEIKQRQELDTHIIKQRREFGAPVADGDMGNRDGEGCAQNEADIAKGIFAKIKHGERVGDTWTYDSVINSMFPVCDPDSNTVGYDFDA